MRDVIVMASTASASKGLEQHIGIYVDTRTAEGQDLLAKLDEKHISYVFVPTRGTPPKLQYGLRRIWGVEKILEYVDSIQTK